MNPEHPSVRQKSIVLGGVAILCGLFVASSAFVLLPGERSEPMSDTSGYHTRDIAGTFTAPPAPPVSSPSSALATGFQLGLSCIDTEAEPGKTSRTRRVMLHNLDDLYTGVLESLTPGVASPAAYIVECMLNGSNYSCTTGNAAHDRTLFGRSNVPEGYRGNASGLQQPLAAPDAVRSELVWESSYASNPPDSVFLLAYDASAIDPALAARYDAAGRASLLHGEGCQTIHDPYGRVFDSHTLEPLAGATVTLLQESDGALETVKNDAVTSVSGYTAIRNPQMTGNDGRFSFYVPDGDYILKASRPGYMFPNRDDLNPAANAFYSDIYRGETIEQRGKVEHRDIPLDPVDLEESEGYAKGNAIRILSYFQSFERSKGIYSVEGSVSHPRATVVLYGIDPNELKNGATVRTRAVVRVIADTQGHFSLAFPTSKLNPNETLGQLEAVKANVGVIKRRNGVLTDRHAVPLDPVLPFVDGYARGPSGTVHPGASVRVRVPFSETPVMETTADANGRFAFPPGRLPPVAFELEVDPEDGPGEMVSTTIFMVRNLPPGGDTSRFYAGVARSGTVLGESEEIRRELELDGRGDPRGLETILALSVAFVVLVVGAIPLYRLYNSALRNSSGSRYNKRRHG
jgi:hypothetical protein